MKNKFSICSSLLVLALTTLISVSTQAQAYDPLRITGLVTAYTPADCGKAGSITIAGQSLTIAAGADTFFVDAMQVINSSGFLTTGTVKSEVWQVLNVDTTPQRVRSIDVYLDSQNRIRFQVRTVNQSLTAARPIDITGAVGAFTAATASTAGSVTVRGLTFTIAPSSSGVPVGVDATKLVRIQGTLNATNQLTVTSVGDPYRKLTVCGASANYISRGGLEVGDVNAFDAEGPIAAVVGFNNPLATPSNPLGSTGSIFQCDESVEQLSVDGAANIFVAPNFSIRQQISKDVNACFELNLDAFNWMSTGSKKITPASPVYGTVSGILTTAPTSSPTGGVVGISGITFQIAGNNSITVSGSPTVGDLGGVCLKQVIDPAGQNGSPLAPGPNTFTPPARLQLINGTTLKPFTSSCHQQ